MRRLRIAVGILAVMGCYTLQPVAGQPLPLGVVVSLGLNDAGRAGMGAQMGPEIAEIEGRLTEKDSDAYVLAVAQVRLLRGGTQVWAGERVRVKTEFVTGVSTKRFSRAKTAIVSAAAISVVVLSIKQGIFGNVAGEEKKTPPDTSLSSRYPRFIKR